MIGTHLDEVDEPRLIKSRHGWWFVGNRSWTLLTDHAVDRSGHLTREIDEHLHEIGAFDTPAPGAYSLTVLTTTSCNLGCGYCFQNLTLDESGMRPGRIPSVQMRPGVVPTIVDFATERMRDAKLEKLDLLLYGGEPLLNVASCTALLRRVQDAGLRSAAMVSNCVLLTEKVATGLAAAGLNGIQVTFDGSREDHDRIRRHRDGRRTFDLILRNIETATDTTRLRWAIRVNVSDQNINGVDGLFDQIVSAVDPARCTITFAWVGDAGFGYHNTMNHDGDVRDRFVDWMIEAMSRGLLH